MKYKENGNGEKFSCNIQQLGESIWVVRQNQIHGSGIKEKGRASIEFYKDGKPQYYCYGYIDKRTDELIDECKECPEHVYKAQADLDRWKKGADNVEWSRQTFWRNEF